MIKQRTIKNTVSVEGIGLQTGGKVRLTLKGSPADSGINFIRTDLPNKPLLNLRSMDLSGAEIRDRRTTLGTGPLEIQTTEHLLAALSGLSVDNVIIELDNAELPGLDGSAKEFAQLLKKGGITEQDSPKKILKIEKPVWAKNGDSVIAAFPDDNFRVSYVLSYDSPSLGTQFFSAVINEKNFECDIAPARTFCLEAEAAMLLKMGLGKGANHENTLVMGQDGPIKNKLRFPDEPVRHKVLDLIGDLYILGMPIQAHVVAMKSGHKLNMEFVKKLKES